MAEGDSKEKELKDDSITLSAALLAPINSIFEAQIHSARAFLNFVLQMGFRHQPSPKELDENPELKQKEEDRAKAKERIKELLQERDDNGSLSSAEVAELKELNATAGDLYYQSIDFIDQTGNDFMVAIPNLALLPIKPLAVQEADFCYEFAVSSETKEYNQMGAALSDSKEEAKGAQTKDQATGEVSDTKEKGSDTRPWFLIQPKSVRKALLQNESK
jgi:hypothetical protein